MSQPVVILLIVGLQTVAFNLVHPIMPSLIISMGFHDWTFGAAFSSMALTSFLYSKRAQMLCQKYSEKSIFLFGCAGYAFTQLMFLTATSEFNIVIWRLICGIFVAMINISSFIYLLKVTITQNRSFYLATLATVITVSTTIGYAIGGIVGDAVYEYAFYLQAASLIIIGLIFFCIGLETHPNTEKSNPQKECNNPFYINLKLFRKKYILITLLVITFLSLTSVTIYEQSLNFFLRKQLTLSPMNIGYIKAITGLITLISNECIATYLMRKAKITMYLSIVFISGAFINLLFVIYNFGTIFIVLNCIFTVFNSIHQPIIQELVTIVDVKQQENLVSLYNEMRSMGWIVDGLVAGYSYSLNPNLPFICTVFIFCILTLLSISLPKLKRDITNQENI